MKTNQIREAAAKKIIARDGIAKQLTAAQKEISRLWVLMCAEEGVPVDSKFVVFTSTNKFSVEYNEAVKKFFALRDSSPANLALLYSPAQWKAAVR